MDFKLKNIQNLQSTFILIFFSQILILFNSNIIKLSFMMHGLMQQFCILFLKEVALLLKKTDNTISKRL